jgi:hypothetical protein
MKLNSPMPIGFALIALVGLSVCGLLRGADGKSDTAATRPATPEQMQRWITNLGSDDYPMRVAATKALADAGAAAEAALRAAVSDSDSERASRAAVLLARMNAAPSLAEREMLEVFQMLSAKESRKLESARVVAGPSCELRVSGRDARVTMRCDAKGIALRAERQGNVNEQSSDLHVRDATELKARYPDAWAFYEWTTRNMGGDDGAAMRKWFEQFLVHANK